MKKVLLVEDDPFIRDLTSIKLSEASYAVIVAHSGETVIKLMQEDTPDVVLLDLDLPGISGVELLTQIKADEVLKKIPVIIFSNNDDPEMKKKTDELGTSGFFVKATTSFDDLLKSISSVVGA